MLSPDQRTETLHDLTATITRSGLVVPVRVVLDVLRPLDFLSSQVAVFMRPFTTGLAFERYAIALTEEASWKELRSLLDRQ